MGEVSGQELEGSGGEREGGGAMSKPLLLKACCLSASTS